MSTTRRDALRATLGRVGIWSFALQTHAAADERAAIATYEALGYTAAWFPESIGSKEAMSHSAILLGGGTRMAIATGIANIYARDAAAMVAGARTIAEAHPGRFVLGVGVSHAPSVAKRGGTYGRPIEAMTAYLDAMDAADWTGPAVERPPLVLAALGPRMLELAAARADGAHPYFVPVEHTRIARERLGPEAVLAVEMTGVIETDRTISRGIARAFAARYLATENYANNLRRLGWADDDIAGGGSDRLIDTIVAQGDAVAIAGRVREHLDAGADHVCVQLRSDDPGDLGIAGYTELRDALGHLMTADAPG
jgi:probable F420-dependent oxidoreductase